MGQRGILKGQNILIRHIFTTTQSHCVDHENVRVNNMPVKLDYQEVIEPF